MKGLVQDERGQGPCPLTTAESLPPLTASRRCSTGGGLRHLYPTPSTVWLHDTQPRNISLLQVRGPAQSHTRLSARARAPIPDFLEPSPHPVSGQETGPLFVWATGPPVTRVGGEELSQRRHKKLEA